MGANDLRVTSSMRSSNPVISYPRYFIKLFSLESCRFRVCYEALERKLDAACRAILHDVGYLTSSATEGLGGDLG